MCNTLQRINVHRCHISKDVEEIQIGSTYPEMVHVRMVSEGPAKSLLPRVVEGMLTFVAPYNFKMQHFMMSALACFLKTREIKNVSSSQI